MLIFLYGPDDFRAKEKIKELRERFFREVDADNVSWAEVDGADLTLEKLHQAAAASSLFARRRLLLVSGIFANKDKVFLAELKNYLANAAGVNDNIIIFYEPIVFLDKNNEPRLANADNGKPLNKTQAELLFWLKDTPYAQYFKILNNQEIASWIKERLATVGLTMGYRAAQILVARLGSDLWLLSNELNKLISYQAAHYGQLTEIQAKTVEEMVQNMAEEKIFALTDALSNKNRALAVKLLEEQLRQGVNEIYLLTMLTRQIKILLSVRSGLDNGLDARAIGQSLKLHPYVLQKSLTQARNFTTAALKIALNALLKLDYNYKTGKLPAPLMMSLLLARL